MHNREHTPLAVEFYVEDVEAAANFYVEKLGFEALRIEHMDKEQVVFAVVAMGEAIVMFLLDHLYVGARAELDERGAGVEVRIMVPDVDAAYERVKEAGLDVLHDIGDRVYGLRDFIARDPYGFRLRFSSPLT